jgi:hypothetical protein
LDFSTSKKFILVYSKFYVVLLRFLIGFKLIERINQFEKGAPVSLDGPVLGLGQRVPENGQEEHVEQARDQEEDGVLGAFAHLWEGGRMPDVAAGLVILEELSQIIDVVVE